MKTHLPFALLAPTLALGLAATSAAKSNFYDEADRLVRTVDSAGNNVSYTYDDADNLLSVVTATGPAAPGSFSAVRSTESTATLAWTDLASGETGYRIERRAATGYLWETVADRPAGTTSFTDTGLPGEVAFVYRVLALGTGGLTSAYSAEALAAGAGSEPFTIRSISLTSSPTSPLELRFEAVAGASYTLESNPSLSPGTWEPATFSRSPGGAGLSEISNVSGITTIYLPPPEGTRHFFRLVRNP